MPTVLEEKKTVLDAKRLELHKIFEEAGDDLDLSKVKAYEGKDDIGRRTDIKKRNDELTEIAKEIEGLQEIADAADNLKRITQKLDGPANRVPHAKNDSAVTPPLKTVRQFLDESKDYKAFREGDLKTAVIEIPEAEFKTLITLTTISAQNERRPGIVEMALETATVADMMMQGATGVTAVEYYEETTVTNAAAEVAEGGTKPESALAYTLRTDNVRKIATWIPATDEALNDVPRLQTTIEGRLMFMVKRREESELLLGDGIAPNILGVMNRTGVQTQAKGADPVPDAIYKAIVLVNVNAFADPTGVVIHPLDWQDIRLLRTADGLYIWGSPSEAGPERIWGLPIRKTTAITQNTALVGAFRPWAEILRREGITITVSTEHSTYFVENKVAILAEERLALAVYRPAAFAKVTGI